MAKGNPTSKNGKAPKRNEDPGNSRAGTSKKNESGPKKAKKAVNNAFRFSTAIDASQQTPEYQINPALVKLSTVVTSTKTFVCMVDNWDVFGTESDYSDSAIVLGSISEQHLHMVKNLVLREHGSEYHKCRELGDIHIPLVQMRESSARFSGYKATAILHAFRPYLLLDKLITLGRKEGPSGSRPQPDQYLEFNAPNTKVRAALQKCYSADLQTVHANTDEPSDTSDSPRTLANVAKEKGSFRLISRSMRAKMKTRVHNAEYRMNAMAVIVNLFLQDIFSDYQIMAHIIKIHSQEHDGMMPVTRTDWEDLLWDGATWLGMALTTSLKDALVFSHSSPPSSEFLFYLCEQRHRYQTPRELGELENKLWKQLFEVANLESNATFQDFLKSVGKDIELKRSPELTKLLVPDPPTQDKEKQGELEYSFPAMQLHDPAQDVQVGVSTSSQKRMPSQDADSSSKSADEPPPSNEGQVLKGNSGASEGGSDESADVSARKRTASQDPDENEIQRKRRRMDSLHLSNKADDSDDFGGSADPNNDAADAMEELETENNVVDPEDVTMPLSIASESDKLKDICLDEHEQSAAEKDIEMQDPERREPPQESSNLDSPCFEIAAVDESPMSVASLSRYTYTLPPQDYDRMVHIARKYRDSDGSTKFGHFIKTLNAVVKAQCSFQYLIWKRFGERLCRYWLDTVQNQDKDSLSPDYVVTVQPAIPANLPYICRIQQEDYARLVAIAEDFMEEDTNTSLHQYTKVLHDVFQSNSSQDYSVWHNFGEEMTKYWDDMKENEYHDFFSPDFVAPVMPVIPPGPYANSSPAAPSLSRTSDPNRNSDISLTNSDGESEDAPKDESEDKSEHGSDGEYQDSEGEPRPTFKTKSRRQQDTDEEITKPKTRSSAKKEEESKAGAALGTRSKSTASDQVASKVSEVLKGSNRGKARPRPRKVSLVGIDAIRKVNPYEIKDIPIAKQETPQPAPGNADDDDEPAIHAATEEDQQEVEPVVVKPKKKETRRLIHYEIPPQSERPSVTFKFEGRDVTFRTWNANDGAIMAKLKLVMEAPNAAWRKDMIHETIMKKPDDIPGTDFSSLNEEDIKAMLKKKHILVTGSPPLTTQHYLDRRLVLKREIQVQDLYHRRWNNPGCHSMASLEKIREISDRDPKRPINALTLPGGHLYLDIPRLLDISFVDTVWHSLRNISRPTYEETIPMDEFRWALYSTPNAFSAPHLDSNGLATVITTVDCEKIWIIGRKKNGSNCLSSAFSKFLAYECFDDYDWVPLLLKPGDLLYMKPGTVHTVLTISKGYTVGEHFFTDTSLEESLMTIFHLCVYNQFLTNANHNHAVAKTLLRLMHCWRLKYEGRIDEDNVPYLKLTMKEQLRTLVMMGTYLRVCAWIEQQDRGLSPADLDQIGAGISDYTTLYGWFVQHHNVRNVEYSRFQFPVLEDENYTPPSEMTPPSEEEEAARRLHLVRRIFRNGEMWIIACLWDNFQRVKNLDAERLVAKGNLCGNGGVVQHVLERWNMGQGWFQSITGWLKDNRMKEDDARLDEWIDWDKVVIEPK